LFEKLVVYQSNRIIESLDIDVVDLELIKAEDIQSFLKNEDVIDLN
jgi:hypothetical protein